ncbi:hypothetical protein [Synechococcus sp. CBW1108]|uniref:hypothetical protein n=1 Tax=Synechococcus sp. CBW1108 TaxID=1353147 RepID=UPI0018CF4C68|nr:hypothetical protein [Synechococcus sp. CBW1108]QPN70068.1 hypothetical protein H8F27_16855 [Synechococcus sp. CBW1108]
MQKKIEDPIASMGRNPHDHSQTQTMSSSTELSKLVRSLPVGPAYALSQSGMGYEILWGMQGEIAGAYPGSLDDLNWGK